WSGSQARDKTGEVSRGTGGQAENGRGHKPGIKQEKSAEVRIRQGQQRIGQGQGCRNKIQGPGKTHTKAETAGLAIP
ncbi:unnamed protein product, partial [Staurois parvus]